MIAEETHLKGCFILKPSIFEDKRGYFFESYNQKKFEDILGEQITFVQDNQSLSDYGVLRGLHFQRGQHAQAKLVRVLSGKVLDVAVDVRENSSTFGEHVAIELSEENKKQFYLPKGFAHGFVVLSKTAVFSYKCDNYYNKASEGGIIYNDVNLNIDWQLPKNKIIISERDSSLPKFETTEL
ncbi:dTDP-4-dehydrorhamnose 3,5-epimerase [Aquimarina sp. ERC-38]|uniref:dTDP-4-dehydrorhamnose 3,5-epimerase n=1 Tax=Aquimarina sp. ERC-38 TaxID=2949996 RepID=UPI0022473ADF|nr:dTDP-4-dehydrorhamnose 3,5-epimerase [Aquimarina sp. ERC-38]UZO81868.1 dTDP-4-dehydrorhamnose 3,5-epimerase [Aquimarina sp. ERC-38]